MKGRTFTPEFKLSIVKAVMSGEKSSIQLCREHNLSDSLIHNWRKLYRQKGETAFTAPTNARTIAPEEKSSKKGLSKGVPKRKSSRDE